MNILSEIDRVFQLEIDTLIQVRTNLDQPYVKAAELIFQCSGKVVVTGLGKSGLIAQKIAATMVSTGTPAFFLHAGDGMHGDVGIIQQGDVLLALSKSGETEELLSLVVWTKRMGVPVIAITAAPTSSLAKGSETVLFTPVNGEACPLNLAPTSSTTAALVVGDALAMVLMKMREFKADHFALFHPGGQLGKRLLMTVADIMRSGEDNPVVNVLDSVPDMLCEMTSKRSGAVSVVDDEGHLLGLVTDYDIRKVLEQGQDIFLRSISEIMNPDPTYICSDDMAFTALEILENRGKPFVVLPVLERRISQVVGMVHIHDLVAKGL